MNERTIVLCLAALAALLPCADSAAQVMQPPCECTVPDNGNGTIDYPATSVAPDDGCAYTNPNQAMSIEGNMPLGTVITVEASLYNIAINNTTPGGNLGGEIVEFDALMEMSMTGSGVIAPFSRQIQLPLAGEVHLAPRDEGAALQWFDADLVRLNGTLFGDPDFDQLGLEAGSDFGKPSSGHATLRRLGPPGTSFSVDSFFDIAYEIDFQGAPGSVLEGFGGPTSGAIRLENCGPGCCSAPDNGSGTSTLPPDDCHLLAPIPIMQVVDGLPPGTTIDIDADITDFMNVIQAPGGNLCGTTSSFDAVLVMPMTGTGDLVGFQRLIQMQVSGVADFGHAPQARAQQVFVAELRSLQGQVFGDPDFCTLEFRAGTDLVAPSPGATSLTRLGPPGSDFQVDSFFDISYRIDFVGCPGSILEGLGGTTQSTSRMSSCVPTTPIFGEGGECGDTSLWSNTFP